KEQLLARSIPLEERHVHSRGARGTGGAKLRVLERPQGRDLAAFERDRKNIGERGVPHLLPRSVDDATRRNARPDFGSVEVGSAHLDNCIVAESQKNLLAV